MTRPIRVGDTVVLEYSDGTAEYGFTVLHIPMDTGDMWYLENGAGVVMAINSMSPKIFAILLQKGGDE